MRRIYPDRDLKILWGLSAVFCAFPGCGQQCIAEAAENDDIAVIGEIAHIQSHSDKGPRANPALTPKERDCYDNWILLCASHHRLLDKQPNTFTAEILRQWKEDLESWVRERLAEEMPEVSFAELEIVTRAILHAPSSVSDLELPSDPGEKMRRNSLTDNVRFLITLGLGKAGEVGEFVEQVATRDPHFPERLKAGFVEEYLRLTENGLNGDALFEALREFAYAGSRNFQNQAAGLAVLVYLFEKCEVFEP